ncbi:hypothetical protein ACROYT_G020167 [Oculina patagonica]
MSFVCILSCFSFVFTRLFIKTEGCYTNVTSLNGTITSPALPPKQADSSGYTCKWNIQLTETDEPRHVELRFTSFDVTAVMPYCSDGNYVELFLGCNRSKSIGRFCGQLSLPVIYSSDHCLLIVLHAGNEAGLSMRHRAVFKAVFKQRLLSRPVSQNNHGCGTEHHANARHGNIFSPHWPLPYPRYVDCVWHVTTRTDLHAKLVFFDFDVRSTDACAEADFLEVKTGGFGFSRGRSVTKSKECGTKDPFVLTIEGDSIFIQFKSNHVTGNRGFMAGFVTYSAEDAEFQPQVLIMLGVIFLILFAFAGKALFQKLLERRRLNKKSIFNLSQGRYRVKSVAPEFHLETPRESVNEPEVLPAVLEPKHVTFQTAATRGKQGSVKTIIIENHEPGII